jgi:Kef-type K+ transport system membrane component KefB
MDGILALAWLTSDPFSRTLMLLALAWLAAKLGGEVAIRLKFPAVAGELGVGLLLAACAHWVGGFPDLAASAEAGTLAQLGVIVLMFTVGLESTVDQMLQVGLPAMRVAATGVVLPMAAGLAGAWLLLPQGTPWVVDLFIGACMCATSIGISAQVLREQGAGSSPEGRIIVGAAVIDDVLGLLVLVAVSGLVTAAHGGFPLADLARTLGLALLFLALSLSLGRVFARRFFQLASRLQGAQLLLPLGLALAFLMAWLGNLAGLAPIVGAYAAGLILEPAHTETLEQRESRSLEQLVQPLASVLAPLFFVIMGAKVDVTTLVQPSTLLLSVTLAVLGVVGKWACGWAAGRGLSRSVVGWGMVPRGEVGLIFVATGAQLQLGGQPLLSPQIQAGVIGAILLTTLAGPVGLSRGLKRIRSGAWSVQ